MNVKYDLIVVRYGEIALKSRYVRNKFETILISNIKNTLKEREIESRIEKEWGRIYIYTDKISHTLNVLKKIFGIISFSPAVKTNSEINSISKKSIEYIKEKIKKEKSFAIRSNRAGNHDFSSKDVAIKIGNDIVTKFKLKVDLTNPDFELFIDIREDYTYIFNKKIKGQGGMPLGSQDKLLCIVNDKTSLLSSFYLLKRGCKILFFTSDIFDKRELENYLKNWFVKDNIIYFNFEKGFFKNINKIVEKEKCKAVISDIYTDDEIDIIKKLNKEIKVPILYPLISMDKIQINNKLKEIGL